jgi:hypothetical protein
MHLDPIAGYSQVFACLQADATLAKPLMANRKIHRYDDFAEMTRHAASGQRG